MRSMSIGMEPIAVNSLYPASAPAVSDGSFAQSLQNTIDVGAAPTAKPETSILVSEQPQQPADLTPQESVQTLETEIPQQDVLQAELEPHGSIFTVEVTTAEESALQGTELQLEAADETELTDETVAVPADLNELDPELMKELADLLGKTEEMLDAPQKMQETLKELIQKAFEELSDPEIKEKEFTEKVLEFLLKYIDKVFGGETKDTSISAESDEDDTDVADVLLQAVVQMLENIRSEDAETGTPEDTDEDVEGVTPVPDSSMVREYVGTTVNQLLGYVDEVEKQVVQLEAAAPVTETVAMPAVETAPAAETIAVPVTETPTIPAAETDMTPVTEAAVPVIEAAAPAAETAKAPVTETAPAEETPLAPVTQTVPVTETATTQQNGEYTAQPEQTENLQAETASTDQQPIPEFTVSQSTQTPTNNNITSDNTVTTEVKAADNTEVKPAAEQAQPKEDNADNALNQAAEQAAESIFAAITHPRRQEAEPERVVKADSIPNRIETPELKPEDELEELTRLFKTKDTISPAELRSESRGERITPVKPTPETDAIVETVPIEAAIARSVPQITLSHVFADSKNGAEQIVTQIVSEIFNQLPENGGTTTFVMTLNPESLGKVTVKLVEEAGKISVSVTAHERRTAEILSQRFDNLQTAMKENGTQLEKYQVVYAPEKDERSGQQSFDGSSKNPYVKQDDEESESDGEFAELLQHAV